MKKLAPPPALRLRRKRVRAADSQVAGMGGSPLETITFVSPQFGRIVLEVEHVAVGSARTEMPGLIKASAQSGRIFLIQNAKSPAAASALLINPEVLQARLAQLRPSRTLAELVESLPFRRHGSPRLRVELPGVHAPKLRVPRSGEKTSFDIEAMQTHKPRIRNAGEPV